MMEIMNLSSELVETNATGAVEIVEKSVCINEAEVVIH